VIAVGPAQPLQPIGVALLLQGGLDVGSGVEVILDRLLAASGDHQDIGQPLPRRLGHDVLQGGHIDYRQQLLGHRLRRGDESRSQSCGWDDGFSGTSGNSSSRGRRVGVSGRRHNARLAK
jgi:hypothetical protein